MMTNNDDGQNSSKMISRKEKEDVATQYMVNWNKDDQRTPLDGWIGQRIGLDGWIDGLSRRTYQPLTVGTSDRGASEEEEEENW